MHEPALVDACTGHRISFGELRHQVRCVAAGLADIGVRKGDVVALWLPNCPQFAVVFHAIARLGAIVTPANPAYTSSELAFQLRDAGAKLLVTTVANTECRIVCPETGRDADVGQPGEVWIRGPQVMKEYLNNPEATAHALNADGRGSHPHTR